MLSWFRSKAPKEYLTYNDRVRAFWQWFQEAAPRLTKTINDKRCPSLAEETSARVDELSASFAWTYGPGADGYGHSLTVSGEGVEGRQLLALHWLSMAPVIPGWIFYAARQAGPIKGHIINMSGLSFDPKEIWVTPSVNTETEKIDLTVWHHSWPQIDQSKRWPIIFLFLDEALGEYGTQWWIGEILCGDDRLDRSFPIEELAEFVRKTTSENEWVKYPPGEGWTLFDLKSGEKVFPRSNLITAMTKAPRLIREYAESDGKWESPLGQSGADYIYVSIDRDFFPAGEEANKRGEIEDALDEVLSVTGSGRCLGGGTGTQYCCVDLLIYDGVKSLEIIRKTLQQLSIPKGTMIEYFSAEKYSHRIAL